MDRQNYTVLISCGQHLPTMGWSNHVEGSHKVGFPLPENMMMVEPNITRKIPLWTIGKFIQHQLNPKQFPKQRLYNIYRNSTPPKKVRLNQLKKKYRYNGTTQPCHIPSNLWDKIPPTTAPHGSRRVPLPGPPRSTGSAPCWLGSSGSRRARPRPAPRRSRRRDRRTQRPGGTGPGSPAKWGDPQVTMSFLKISKMLKKLGWFGVPPLVTKSTAN